MSARYQAVAWNRQKRAYDRVLAVGVIAYLAVFLATGAALFRDATAATLLIRGLGTAAFVLLHIILCIGPLCRLAPRFLPLLYNRRHLGVMNPGDGIVHRACANLCIRGGIPPIFVFQDSGGQVHYTLLHTSSGERLRTDILPFVGRPVSPAAWTPPSGHKGR